MRSERDVINTSQQEEPQKKDKIRFKKEAEKVEKDDSVKSTRKNIDNMTYEELVKHTPIEVPEKALPLTQENLSAMNNSKAQWNVVSSTARDSQGVPEVKKVNFNQDFDLKKVKKSTSDDEKLSQGWNIPQQMDETEIQKRQTERNKHIPIYNLVQVPPVPHQIMGKTGHNI